MEKMIVTQSKPITFEFSTGVTGYLFGEKFRIDYNDNRKIVQFKIDCSSSLKEPKAISGKADAHSFIESGYDNLKSISITNRKILTYFEEHQKKGIKNSAELILTFDEDYSYNVEIIPGENDKISFKILDT
jgi:hypothetical protein